MKFKEFKTSSNESIISKTKDGKVVMKTKRPILLLSNSSYSIDDDFEMLLKACEKFEAQNLRTKLILIMSGSGVLKPYWSNKFMKTFEKSDKIKVYFKWFKQGDYPLICGSVDYGVCLHNSTSKVDLPIKILDIFACSVPVLAYKYSNTIKELVKNDVNGKLFENAQELSKILEKIEKGKLNLKREFDSRGWV